MMALWMPCAINYGTAIAGSKRADHIWNVYAADLDLEDTFSLDEDFPQSEQNGRIMCVVS